VVSVAPSTPICCGQILGVRNTLREGDQQLGCNIGSTIPIGDVTIHVVPAMHSSEPSGRPVGFALTFSDGRSVYHTGDTWIFGDMALIEELYHPVVILQNVGGGYWGSDPKTAALGIKKYFNPEVR
jgi:L-ascorbate metabolism protein UlaG (beta-lactamase superfamily)